MVRLFAVACCLAQTGCSLILDFSDSQIPIDAPPDVFTVAECSFKEPNDSFEAAIAYDPAEGGAAALCADGFDDTDFYKLTVPAGITTLTIAITFVDLAGDLDLFLYDATGIQQSFSAGNIDNESIVCPGTAPACMLGATPPIAEGDYVFEVRGPLAVQNTYSIAVTLAP
ncbi:MAG: PPC domain-containing protein [Deltaproteobacteria bacterium]|nr:PPC domain-containing protein [Deltaproteobacteria bacterium]